MGLVLKQGICTEVPTDNDPFTKSELLVRISIGGKQELVDKIKVIDYTSLQRLHISVYGARQFFPDRGEVRDVPVLEEVHVSFRWLENNDGILVYDDWSGLQAWYADAVNDNIIDRKRFSESRTTYCRSKFTSVLVANEKLSDFIKSQGRKRPTFNLSRDFKSQVGSRDIGAEILYHFLDSQIPSAISYEGVQGALYEFLPKIPFEKTSFQHATLDKELHAMTPKQGIEFLFCPVLQGIEKFVNT
jgi:hypothetical protein